MEFDKHDLEIDGDRVWLFNFDLEAREWRQRLLDAGLQLD